MRIEQKKRKEEKKGVTRAVHLHRYPDEVKLIDEGFFLFDILLI